MRMITKKIGCALCGWLCFAVMTTVLAAPLPNEVKVGNSTVKMGDKIDKAITAFGRPWHIGNEKNYYWRDRIDLYSPEVVAKTYGSSKKIYELIIDRVPTINTREGIGIGSSRDDVEKAYGKGKERRVSNGDIILSYGKDEKYAPYTRFRLNAKTNTVYYMVIGSPDNPKNKKRR